MITLIEQIQNALTEKNLAFDYVGTNNDNKIVIELPKTTNKLHVGRVLKSLGISFTITNYGFDIPYTGEEEEEPKQLTPIQELDKECLEQNIEQLIVLTNESKQIESKIEYVKKAIEEYAAENGVIYSDSSYSVSLVYTPSVEWNDEQIENCDLHIAQFEEQIKAIKDKQNAFKEMRKARISELQNEIKADCLKENKGINQIWSEFDCIKSFKDNFQVRIAKSKISQKTQKHESEFERSWIYKK